VTLQDTIVSAVNSKRQIMVMIRTIIEGIISIRLEIKGLMM
jgi:hypothetical protein